MESKIDYIRTSTSVPKIPQSCHTPLACIEQACEDRGTSEIQGRPPLDRILIQSTLLQVYFDEHPVAKFSNGLRASLPRRNFDWIGRRNLVGTRLCLELYLACSTKLDPPTRNHCEHGKSSNIAYDCSNHSRSADTLTNLASCEHCGLH